MSEVIQLNHQAENTYEFDLQIEGISAVEVKAWFVIVVKGMELSFPCTQDKSHFTCVIPPMPFIERTAYKGAVRLVADDYFFEVISDMIVNVMGNLSFERSDLTNMKVKSTIDGKDVVKEAVNTEKTVKTDVKRVESPNEIAKRITSEKKFEFNNPSKKKKNSTTKLSESKVADKNMLIEEEISEFVNTEQAERAAKLREILKGFTVAPQSTPTKTKFIKKS